MSGYNTRSGARGGTPTNLPPATADNSAAGAVQGTAVQTQAVPVIPVIGSPIGSGEVSENNECIMSTFSQSLKDPKILMLRAELNAAHKSVDETDKEVDKQIVYVEQAKKDSVPKEMIHSYSTRLNSLLTQGETQLKAFTLVQDQLSKQLDYLSMVYEEQPSSKKPVDTLREKVRSVFSPYKG